MTKTTTNTELFEFEVYSTRTEEVFGSVISKSERGARILAPRKFPNIPTNWRGELEIGFRNLTKRRAIELREAQARAEMLARRTASGLTDAEVEVLKDKHQEAQEMANSYEKRVGEIRDAIRDAERRVDGFRAVTDRNLQEQTRAYITALEPLVKPLQLAHVAKMAEVAELVEKLAEIGEASDDWAERARWSYARAKDEAGE